MELFLDLFIKSIGYTAIAAFIIFNYIRILLKKPREFNIKFKPWKLDSNKEITIN